MSLIIVDTGCANLASVTYAFERLGIDAIVTDHDATINSADRVVLPGVGSAPFAMKSINSKGLTPILRALEQPVLGICLGMQLLFETLQEGDQETFGLGLVPGTIKKLDTQSLPAPHMGWNILKNEAEDPLLRGVEDGDHAYFVHSYAAPITSNTLASSQYGSAFSAVVRQENVWGCQFHPERSSKTGAQILRNFVEITL